VPDHNLAGIYRASRERLTTLAPTLTAERARTPVPTCPEWTVRDVIAHLAANAADVLGNRMSGIPRPEDTNRQIEGRSDWSISEICAAWNADGPAIDELIRNSDRALTILVFDCWTHDQDIHNALGIVSGRDGPGLALVAEGIWKMKRIIRNEGLAPLRVVTASDDWLIGEGAEPATTLRIHAYELARMVMGRRSLDQMLAYDWVGDPIPYLHHIPAFEPPSAAIIE
jgi:uncharacterized protein (TIGR03083 family)